MQNLPEGVAQGVAQGAEKTGNFFTTIINWIKALWDKVDIKNWSQEIGGGSAEAVEAAIYFGSGFAIGFLFKKYFKFLLLTFVTAIILIKILEYNMVLEIDWEGMNVLMGFDSAADFNTIINDIFSWIKNNFIIFISSVVGFLVGYKLG